MPELNKILIIFIFLLSSSASHADEYGKSVQAFEVMKNVESNLKTGKDIVLNNLIIDGDLNINKISPPQINGDIKIENSIINGNVSLYGLNMSKSLSLYNTTIEQYLYVNNTRIKGILNLCNAKLNKSSFEYSKFESNAKFEDTIFHGNGKFSNAIFMDCDFINAKFLKDALFNNVSFRGLTKFENATFIVNAEFSKSRFGNMALFNLANFSEAKFEYSTFDFDANFYNASFLKSAVFDNSVFNGDALFEKANISLASFEKATFRAEAYFFQTIFDDAHFNEAKVDRDLVFEGIKFRSPKSIINLNNTRIEKLYGRWQFIRGHLEFNDEAYLHLIQNYKALGLRIDANDCYYEYRLAYEKRFFPIRRGLPLYPLSKNLVHRSIDAINMLVYGYGVKPDRPFYFGSIMIIFISFFYWKFDNFNFAKALRFSATVFLSGSGRLLVKTPNYKPSSKEGTLQANILEMIFTFEQLLGASIFVALLIGINNTILW